MSLYGDLPRAKDTKNLSNESNPWLSTEFITTTSTIKQQQQQQQQQQKASTNANVLNASHAPKLFSTMPPQSIRKQAFKQHNKHLEDNHISDLHKEKKTMEHYTTTLDLNFFGDIKDEYDPAKPNDYEEVMKEREKKKLLAEQEAARQEEIRKEIERKEAEQKRMKEMMEREKERQQQEKELKEKEEELEREEATFKKRNRARSRSRSRSRQRLGDSSSLELISNDNTKSETQITEKGMTLAQKMLEKFGWREGEGLGKERQGMATPLIAQKTDRRSAVIVNAELKKSQAEAIELKKQKESLKIDENPTKVILLRNLVGPGEVDDSLEDEVANEAQNYGKVLRVLIFEVTETDFPADEAIRIFIEFQKLDEAIKAVNAMNGRFFGGRTVKAGFYDEDKFEKCDLAPLPGEFTIKK